MENNTQPRTLEEALEEALEALKETRELLRLQTIRADNLESQLNELRNQNANQVYQNLVAESRYLKHFSCRIFHFLF